MITVFFAMQNLLSVPNNSCGFYWPTGQSAPYTTQIPMSWAYISEFAYPTIRYFPPGVYFDTMQRLHVFLRGLLLKNFRFYPYQDQNFTKPYYCFRYKNTSTTTITTPRTCVTSVPYTYNGLGNPLPVSTPDPYLVIQNENLLAAHERYLMIAQENMSLFQSLLAEKKVTLLEVKSTTDILNTNLSLLNSNAWINA